MTTLITQYKTNKIDLVIAQKILLILLECAVTGLKINYKDLAERVGLPTHGNALGTCLGPYLDYINWMCLDRNQPLLSTLVVTTSGNMKGYPGQGYYKLLIEWGIYKPLDDSAFNRRLWTDAYTLKVFAYWSFGSTV